MQRTAFGLLFVCGLKTYGRQIVSRKNILNRFTGVFGPILVFVDSLCLIIANKVLCHTM